jgi:hypothetical protein
MLVSIPLRRGSLYAWCSGLLLLCMAFTNAWSDTDKTTVDLERGQPEAASRYYRPRAVQQYQYDKTEVDLATPLTQQPGEAPRATQRPATLPPPLPAPATPPPQAPLPGGGR